MSVSFLGKPSHHNFAISAGNRTEIAAGGCVLAIGLNNLCAGSPEIFVAVYFSGKMEASLAVVLVLLKTFLQIPLSFFGVKRLRETLGSWPELRLSFKANLAWV